MWENKANREFFTLKIIKLQSRNLIKTLHRREEVKEAMSAATVIQNGDHNGVHNGHHNVEARRDSFARRQESLVERVSPDNFKNFHSLFNTSL